MATSALLGHISASSAGSTVSTEQVRAELLAYAPQGVGPGQSVWVGLQLTHAPQWHTYWKNSGDSGQPTQLNWTLPEGVVAGDIAWPTPKKFRIGPLANYGYEGTVLLPVPLAITPAFKPTALGGDLLIRLHATWLVCRIECIPQEGQFSLKLPVQSTTALHGAAFEAAWRAQPRTLADEPQKQRLANQARVQNTQLDLRVHNLPASLRGQPLELFVETPEVIETAGAWTQTWSGGAWRAQVPLSPYRAASPARLPVVLVATNGQSWRADLPLQGTWSPVAAPTQLPAALQAALQANAASHPASSAPPQRSDSASPTPGSGAGIPTVPTSPLAQRFEAPPVMPATAAGFWLAVIGAILGGALLNFMPCVFPVLAIKVLGLSGSSYQPNGHRTPGQRLGVQPLRLQALAYAAGVVLSFMLLGALMLGLRAAGEAVGWGFQLQSPWMVAALATLFTLIGLNLAGVFDWGQLLPSSVTTLRVRHPVADALLTGVLAVAVASPCTAPFMGASIGLTATLPAGQAMALFAAVGLGMALPYVLLSWVPAWSRVLPRPGPWMEQLRKLLAFPMWATAVWLVWVLGHQSGIDGAAALLALLVALSMWVWSCTLAGRVRLILSPLALALLALLAWALGPYVGKSPPEPSAAETAPAIDPGTAAVVGTWQPWSAQRVEQLVASGQTVFVDFTAAWCVTCQVNKKTTLSHPQVLEDLAAKRVVLLRADWTRRDSAITAALAQLGRSGVPVYVFYRAGKSPVVLSELLSVQEVRAAAAQL